MMRSAVIVLLVSAAFLSCSRQPIVWREAKNWKIYEVNNENEAFRYSLDTLQYIRNKPLNDDSMRYFLSAVSVIPVTSKMNAPLWMGAFLATCQLMDGSTRKIVISVYGAFFYDSKARTYYQLPQSVKPNWISYISNGYGELEDSDPKFHNSGKKEK